jgi:predicted membrane-bound mannosyltransferase
VVMTAVYAAIPYKTPWCVLGFLHALILLAGVGGARLIEVSSTRLARRLVAAILGAAVAHLGGSRGQAVSASRPIRAIPGCTPTRALVFSRSRGASRPCPARIPSAR